MYVIYLYKTFAKGGWGIKIRFNVTSYFICFSKKDASSKDHKRSQFWLKSMIQEYCVI